MNLTLNHAPDLSVPFAGILSVLLLTACGNQADSEDASEKLDSLKEVAEELNRAAQIEIVLSREGDAASVARGAQLFKDNCIECHLEGAAGAPGWHKRDPAGNYPPPPLNGTAHTWHHPKAQLLELIRNGSKLMPPFGPKLNDKEITDIIHWIQSLWPDDVYSSWAQINKTYEQSTN